MEISLPYHTLANIFNLIEGKDYDDLCKDISDNGLIEPITLLDGEILDGRNRFRACIETQIQPEFIAYGEREAYDDFPYFVDHRGELKSPAAYVWSKNFTRRHLTIGQRAMAGVKLKEYYAEEAKKRQLAAQNNDAGKAVSVNLREQVDAVENKGKSSEKAAQDVGVSSKAIEQAEYIEKNADEATKNNVKQGKESLSSAYQKTKNNGQNNNSQSKPSASPAKPKPAKEQKLIDENQALKATLAELEEKNAVLVDELQSYVDLDDDAKQQAMKANQLRERIRALESQRDDLMNQVNQWKREVKALRKRLGEK